MTSSTPTCWTVVSGMPGSADALAGRWQELWQEERASLRPLPARLPAACVSRVAKVNRRQQVRFAGNWYSVRPGICGPPGDCPGLRLQGGRWPARTRCIASHGRSYGREEEVLDPHHYLPVLLKKPGAFARATPILKWPLPAVYEAYHRQLQERREGSGGTREYIRILMLLKDHPLQEVTAAVEQAAALGLYGYEAVKNLSQRRAGSKPLAPVSAGVAQPGGPLRPAGAAG